MTTVVKCNSCDIVIDELLCYVQNKISIIDEETLVKICTTSFSSDEIKNSKTLLFESIPTDKIKINRKNKGREGRDLADIINLFKGTEPDAIPVFVARQLEKLPPVLFDHLDCTKLLKDLLKVRNELNEIKSHYVTQDQLSECRNELLKIKNDSLPIHHQNVNLKRGAWLYGSGPVSFSDLNDSELNKTSDNDVNILNKHSDPIQFRNVVRVDQHKQNKCQSAERRSISPTLGNCKQWSTTKPKGMNRGVEMTSPQPSMTTKRRSKALAAAVIPADATGSERHSEINTVEEVLPVSDGNIETWQTVSRRRKYHYRYHGASGIARDMEGNFKAADTKIPIFITKVHTESSEKDIMDHIYLKTKEMISLEKIIFKHEKDYNAYKFYVPERKLSLFLDDKLWPQGIIFRRFIHFKRRYTNGNRSVSLSQHNIE